jgi:microcystin-dependent protein
MADPFVAEIRIFPFNYAPSGWAFCNGALLPISGNTVLYQLLGTTYGGNGISNFALPNLQGSAPLQAGQGAGLSNRTLGQSGGEATHTLTTTEIPSHTHTVSACNGAGTKVAAQGNTWAIAGAARGKKMYSSNASSPSQMATQAVAPTGNDPHNNMPPYLTLNFCIALQGVYPS